MPHRRRRNRHCPRGTYSAGGRTWQGHSGNYGGFTSLGGTDVSQGVTLMVVTNRDAPSSPATKIFTALAEAYPPSAG